MHSIAFFLFFHQLPLCLPEPLHGSVVLQVNERVPHPHARGSVAALVFHLAHVPEGRRAEGWERGEPHSLALLKRRARLPDPVPSELSIAAAAEGG
jgi:hypothetical protein